MTSLPEDLDRLGEQLAGAASRRLAARARRRRIARAAVIGALAFAVLTPGALAPGLRDLGGANLAGVEFGPLGCDRPRGTELTLPACEGPMVLYRPYAVR